LPLKFERRRHIIGCVEFVLACANEGGDWPIIERDRKLLADHRDAEFETSLIAIRADKRRQRYFEISGLGGLRGRSRGAGGCEQFDDPLLIAGSDRQGTVQRRWTDCSGLERNTDNAKLAGCRGARQNLIGSPGPGFEKPADDIPVLFGRRRQKGGRAIEAV